MTKNCKKIGINWNFLKCLTLEIEIAALTQPLTDLEILYLIVSQL